MVVLVNTLVNELRSHALALPQRPSQCVAIVHRLPGDAAGGDRAMV